ncbi:hypothetical protein [Bradyrhizobium sp. BWC-3-1]|uniref:hypothetical protein n=1 Tax=Bradyrhizobium sp. BWC-3-1 TaxID=3080012 RepID=UPI00293F5E0D|nr:hypothetical protein [Bradyrhizobium sp. BWC-3-1]WOH55295.1 hypothetical protein RX329_23575 [Bradyrhizobium sp. BWC-3-1]
MFELRSVEELMRIASAGGGFRLDAHHRSTEDLMKIAYCSKASGARITFTNMAHRQTNDLIRIASSGAGNVSFEAG